MKSNRELAEVKNAGTALDYDNGNRSVLEGEFDLVHIISSKNQVDYNTEYDRKVFNDIADKLLEITISSYSVIERGSPVEMNKWKLN